MGNKQFVNGMCEYFTEAKKILEDAAREKEEGIQGQWQQESPFREVLEQVRKSADADCGPQRMRQGYLCNAEWQLGRLQRKTQEGRKVV